MRYPMSCIVDSNFLRCPNGAGCMIQPACVAVAAVSLVLGWLPVRRLQGHAAAARPSWWLISSPS